MNQNSKNIFETSTDIQYNKDQSLKAMIVLFFVLSCLATLGLLIALQTFLIFEMLASFICFVTYYVTQKNIHDYRLYFEDDFLLIKDRTTGEAFEVYDIPASDFIINQTKRDKKRNYCSMAIKHTVFAFGGVKNYRELKEYIEAHYA